MNFDIPAIWDAGCYIIKALPNTLFIPLATLIPGIFLGTLVALARMYCPKIVRLPLVIGVSFVRAVPAIVQVFIMYYSLPYFLAPILSPLTGTTVKSYDVSPYWIAYIFFIIYQTAYQSENIRGALLSVNKGQLEAALSVGLSHYQAMKRIILPQALAVALPSFFTYYLHGVKALALLFTIKIVDIFSAADIYASLYSRRTEPYLASAVIYWLLCVVLTPLFNRWERALRNKGLQQ